MTDGKIHARSIQAWHFFFSACVVFALEHWKLIGGGAKDTFIIIA